MPTPLQDLETIQRARATVLNRARWPVGYHLVVAAMGGGLVAAMALPDPLPSMAASLVAIGSVLLANWSRSRLGFFVNGWRWGRTLWVSMITLAVLLGGVTLSILRQRLDLPDWTPFAAGAVVFVCVFFTGRLWERVYRAELASAA
ncbi:hypothetical protein QO010_001801 [Caulobacter ginsengisoli]|uniref:Transmembrane protein n=1 Tax=Caulobacter ginsengisoli TaxID=400775 RepID=A0ABU0IPV1_9CAUL|nr:hypothetical protein [Caulobacter ginsengisoli]MDQ0464030.1 hypothetical protein [Caulobacter ginsengisoli]